MWKTLFDLTPSKLLPNSIRYYRACTAPYSNEAGLYGFSHLKSPQGFQRFVDDAIERSGELINYISGMPSPPDIIKAMDEISDTVCCVVDSAELCRHTHPDREFIVEANKASMRINDYLHYLNTNHTLYNAIMKTKQDSYMLSEEGKRAAQYLCKDFEKGGIHLCAEKLERVNQLNINISQLCMEFNENIATDPGFVDIFPALRVPRQLHNLLKPIYRSSNKSRVVSSLRNSLNEKGFRISTEQGILTSVLQTASDDEVRKLAYITGNSVPRSNLAVLDKLISARHEMSQLLGCKSYAEFVVHPNMASSPEVVESFLCEMSEMVRPKADEEFRRIRDYKRERTGKPSVDLEPWDEAYYTGMMKSSTFNLDSLVVVSYFPLSQCIGGLKVLVESLFGATFQDIPMEPGESWHPDVLKLSLRHPDEGDLGYLYLDLYSRKNKYPGCAHFAIRGGRRISETEYQLPVVALVCNFSGSRNSSNARLTHYEVETLFHEFGHALHSLLSRTDYQHFSGTRMVLDLAETPSNLFEYYAWDYRVLKRFAKHYSTGEVIPEKLVQSMQGAKKKFAATEFQRQIFYSLIDQKLFGDQPLPPRDTVSIVADLKRKHMSWKHLDGTHWHTRFTHLLNYGAGYYSYLYAKCFASTIWKKLCEDDPLSLDTGTALRRKFLQHGGSKDPSRLLNDLVGDGILRYQNGGIIPDTTSLRDEMNMVDGKK